MLVQEGAGLALFQCFHQLLNLLPQAFSPAPFECRPHYIAWLGAAGPSHQV